MDFDLSARQSVCFLGAAMIAALGMLASYPLAKRVGAISQVRVDRWHTRPFVPRFAGPALLVAIAPWASQAHLMILAGFCFVGCLDDLRPLIPRLKFLLLLVPALVTWTLTGSLWQAVACFIMATSLNLLDHADGLAGSVSLVSLALAEGALGLSGAGACFGFLLHNFPPARAFLGDGGSHLLGAMLVLAWADHGIGATCLGCLIPLLDTGFVAVRRLVEGRRPWVGGTDHTGHVLLRAGVTPKLLPLVYASCAGIAVVAGRRWLL